MRMERQVCIRVGDRESEWFGVYMHEGCKAGLHTIAIGPKHAKHIVPKCVACWARGCQAYCSHQLTDNENNCQNDTSAQ